jgi:hypothetical protein
LISTSVPDCRHDSLSLCEVAEPSERECSRNRKDIPTETTHLRTSLRAYERKRASRIADLSYLLASFLLASFRSPAPVEHRVAGERVPTCSHPFNAARVQVARALNASQQQRHVVLLRRTYQRCTFQNPFCAAM